MVSSHLQKLYKSGDMYLIEETLPDDDEPWYRVVEWDKETNKATLTEKNYYSHSSLYPPPKKVPKAFFSSKKKRVILARII
jgi:hypothetical protein